MSIPLLTACRHEEEKPLFIPPALSLLITVSLAGNRTYAIHAGQIKLSFVFFMQFGQHRLLCPLILDMHGRIFFFAIRHCPKHQTYPPPVNGFFLEYVIEYQEAT